MGRLLECEDAPRVRDWPVGGLMKFKELQIYCLREVLYSWSGEKLLVLKMADLFVYLDSIVCIDFVLSSFPSLTSFYNKQFLLINTPPSATLYVVSFSFAIIPCDFSNDNLYGC